jgi:hypothetical protein
MSLFAAANNAGAHGDVTEARERLESTLPPERTHGIPEEVLRHAPDHVRRHLLAGPPVNDIVSRVAERLEMLGASHTGVGWRTEGEHGYLEVGLDPYSEDAAQRVRLMCEPVEVRFVQGPRRPPGPFGRAPDDV